MKVSPWVAKARESGADWLITIDPGLRKGGVAVANADTLQIVLATTWHAVDESKALDAAITAARAGGRYALAIERMVRYPDRRDTWHTLDRITDAFRSRRDPRRVGTLTKPTPWAWKRSLPKSVCRLRIRAELSPLELSIMPPESEHDAWDATGIMLVLTGRLGPGLARLRGSVLGR